MQIRWKTISFGIFSTVGVTVTASYVSWVRCKGQSINPCCSVNVRKLNNLSCVRINRVACLVSCVAWRVRARNDPVLERKTVWRDCREDNEGAVIVGIVTGRWGSCSSDWIQKNHDGLCISLRFRRAYCEWCKHKSRCQEDEGYNCCFSSVCVQFNFSFLRK